ncbi:hypothetical protein LJC38_07905, partial [Parabacteroides sp. OttesenSCG-928-K15]|nr:hypothetical protein [Parabacteroides sp. OttesenSCG-928-K15]
TDRHIPPLQAAPWGISPQNRQFFEDLSIIPGREVLVSAWKEEYATLSGRQTAAHCLDIIRQKATTPLPETPFFLYSIDELSEYITTHTPPFVLKMPFSSSGRGLLRLDDRIPDKEREWISGAFRKQGSLSIEKRLRKEKDFALEFELDIAGNIRYHGISLFETAGWKTYCGNLLAGQQEMEEEIINLVGEAPFREIKRLVGEVVQEVFGGIYSGYLGVDMMVYSDDEGAFRIHPCVEINMRYTMGMVAIRLFENYIDPAAKGLFQVVYERDAWQRHREMQQAHPQKWKSGKLLSGYLPLTPVISSTQYRAFVLIA